MIERAKNRDEQAFLALIQRCLFVIRAVIGKYIRNITGYEEEDIMKMVIVYAWEKITEFRGGEEAFKCWLRRKTQWICLDLLQKQKQEGKTIPLGPSNDNSSYDPPDPAPNPLEELAQKEKLEAVQNAMNALPEQYKRVISLTYRGLSYKEIAEILNIPIGTVMSRLNRGKEQIKTLLNEWGMFNEKA